MKIERKKNRVLLLYFLVLLLLASPTAVWAKKGDSNAKELVVGAVVPLSGPISIVGMAFSRGYEMLFEKVNKELGGIDIGNEKYLIKLIVEDSKSSTEASAIAARKIVYQDKAKFVFGSILPGPTQAVGAVCKEAKVAHMISNMSVPGCPADVGPDKPLTVRVVPSVDNTNTMNYDYLIKTYPRVKTVAITGANVGMETMIEDATYVANQRGLKVVHVELYPFGTRDFIPHYTRLLAKKPDAIHVLISGQAHYQLMAVRQLGFKGPLFSESPLGPDVFVRVAGAEVCTDVFCNGLNPEQPTEVMQEIMDRWQKKYGEKFVSDTVSPWDQAWILVQALTKAQSANPEQVISVLKTMTNKGDLQTSFGAGYMTGKDRFGVNAVLERPIPISHMTKGQIKLIGYFFGSNR